MNQAYLSQKNENQEIPVGMDMLQMQGETLAWQVKWWARCWLHNSIIYLEKGKVYYSTQSTLKHLNISEVVSLWESDDFTKNKFPLFKLMGVLTRWVEFRENARAFSRD